MNSPVLLNFDFICLDKKSNTPIYIQLVDQIINAIQRGYLHHGYRFPGTRCLSKLIKLNRNTIVKSFSELEDLGWIKIIPNKGTYVQNEAILEKNSVKIKAGFPSKASFYFENSELLKLENVKDKFEFYLNDGKPDPYLSELKLPAKIYSNILNRKQYKNKLGASENIFFLKHFTNYINSTRNLSISHSNILITKNHEMALQLVTKVITIPKDYIAVSEISNFKSNMILQSNQINLIPIEIDNLGIILDDLRIKSSLKNIKAIYINTQQYPTTTALNSQRKIELLNFAKEKNCVIIEDDPDFDFYYTSRPTTPLASINNEGNIIYIGKFGNELGDNYNFSYIIAPSDFIIETKKHQAVYENPIHPLVAQTIGEIINEGEISKILRKHRKKYKERRDYFCNLLIQHFGNEIEFNFPKNGFAVWVKWKIPINLMRLKQDCEKKNLYIPQHILYQNKKITAMRIGFAHLEDNEMIAILKILQICINKQFNKAEI